MQSLKHCRRTLLHRNIYCDARDTNTRLDALMIEQDRTNRELLNQMRQINWKLISIDEKLDMISNICYKTTIGQ